MAASVTPSVSTLVTTSEFPELILPFNMLVIGDRGQGKSYFCERLIDSFQTRFSRIVVFAESWNGSTSCEKYTTIDKLDEILEEQKQRLMKRSDQSPFPLLIILDEVTGKFKLNDRMFSMPRHLETSFVVCTRHSMFAYRNVHYGVVFDAKQAETVHRHLGLSTDTIDFVAKMKDATAEPYSALWIDMQNRLATYTPIKCLLTTTVKDSDKALRDVMNMCLVFSTFERTHSGSFYREHILKEDTRRLLNAIKFIFDEHESIQSSVHDFLTRMMNVYPELAFPYVVCFGTVSCSHANDTFGVFGKPVDMLPSS